VKAAIRWRWVIMDDLRVVSGGQVVVGSGGAGVASVAGLTPLMR